MVVTVSRDDVIAFRLQAHHLAERWGRESLVEACGSCGIQNSPPGSALLALHARVDDMSEQRLDEACFEDKNLLQTWCMRGAPYVIPTVEAQIFTLGVLPPTEEALRQFILGVGPSLDRLDLTLTEAVDLCRNDIAQVLTGRRLAINELGVELASRVAESLSPSQRKVWDSEGRHAKGQPVGEAVVHFCLRILTLRGVVCFAQREGRSVPFVLVDDWLEAPPADTTPETARAELIRRYLKCYGPSTRADFAAWLGVRAGDVGPWWDPIEGELTEVDAAGRRSWILTDDLEELRSSPAPEGTRLLPPRDPYVQVRDRDTIVEKKFQREVWRTVGDPGTILVNGEIIGIWRPRKAGKTLGITMETFTSPNTTAKEALNTEAEQIGHLRGASIIDVSFSSR